MKCQMNEVAHILQKTKNCIVEWQQQQVNNHCMLVDLNLRITNVHCPLQDWPTALPFSDLSISDTGALTSVV